MTTSIIHKFIYMNVGMMKYSKYVNIQSVNSLYLTIGEVYGSTECSSIEEKK